MEAQMNSGPRDIVFENTIAALGYFTGIGVALRTTGLFDPGDNACVGDKIVDRFLLIGIPDLCRDSGCQYDSNATNSGQECTLSLGQPECNLFFQLLNIFSETPIMLDVMRLRKL